MDKPNVAEKEVAPETGPGSPAGPRWFVSSRHPHLVVTITPALDKTDTQRAIKGVYANFKSLAKPDVFRGDGKRGTDNHSGTDMNDVQQWGIFSTYDPGPEPEDGWTDDGKDVPRAQRRTAAQKALFRKTVEVLRNTDYYGKTIQNNQVTKDSLLVELDWDPTPLSGTLTGHVQHGNKSLGKKSAQEAPAAPAETRLAAPAPKVPPLTRKTAAPAA